MREIKFRAWDGNKMDYDYRDATLWNGLLVAEGDTVLMQFTGLLDKNGKEIYEGDVLKAVSREHNTSYSRLVVRWESDYWHGLRPFAEWSAIHWFTLDFIEVIGNIHENPELVENL